MIQANSGTPELGGGATILSWSDRYPATVIEIIPFRSGPRTGQPRIVRVQEDSWEVVSGSASDGSAKYLYFPNPEGMITEFRMAGKKWSGPGEGIAFGFRDKYYDPHF
jgi:hypothetical protein